MSDPILISYDENNFIRARKYYENAIPTLQDVVTKYNALGLDALTPTEFINLIENPVELVFDKMTGGDPVSIGGLEVDKKKAIELLVKPAGYETLLAAISDLATNGIEDHNNQKLTLNRIKNWFELNSSHVVILNATAITKLQSQFKLFATSQRAQNVLQFAQDFLTSIADLGIDKEILMQPDGVNGFFKVVFDPQEGKPLTISGKGVARFNSTEMIRP